MQLFKRFPVKIGIGLVGLALVVFAVIVLAPSPAPADPVISWVPESVNETILAGETKTVSATFTASEDFGAVEVRVVPALEPFVQVSPTSFENLVAGQETSIEITISSPADSLPQVVDGTIQIRNAGRPPRNFAKPLGVKITVWKSVQRQRLTVGYPPSWRPDSRFTEPNQPIVLDTFNQYGQGGVIPKGGAVISIIKKSLQTTSIDEEISKDSRENAVLSTSSILVSDFPATRIIYTIPFEPLFSYSNTVVYVNREETLYKFSLLYRQGDDHTDEFNENFQEILNTVRFAE